MKCIANEGINDVDRYIEFQATYHFRRDWVEHSGEGRAESSASDTVQVNSMGRANGAGSAYLVRRSWDFERCRPIQPRGKTKALVGKQDRQALYNRRAAIEPCIGHLKTRGLGRSRMKSDLGDLISGYRSALSWNLSLLMRDLSTKKMDAAQCFG